MHASQPVADKLLRDVGQTVAIPLKRLLRSERRTLTDAVENITSAVGYAAVQFPGRITIKCPALWIGRIALDPRHLQRLTVVKRCVTAAMMHNDRMFLRDLIEIMN